MSDDRYEQDTAGRQALAADLRLVIARLNRRLREQSVSTDLTGSQKSALLRIERDGPATITTLARAEGVRPQSMGATVAALEAAGHVAGQADPSDGRQTIWSLTTACRDWINAGRAAREDWLFHTLENTLTPAEQERLAETVDLLRRLADS